MAEARGLSIHAIAVEHGFADTLAETLLDRFRDPELGLARVTLLAPNQRAVRAFTEALIRRAGEGLLLPRQVVVGDLELGEKLGARLDPLGAAPAIPPAIEPLERQLRLARLVQEQSALAGTPRGSDEALRLAGEFARVTDQLLIEEKTARSLTDLEVESELAEHWQRALGLFRAVAARWEVELSSLGRIEAADRRNRLLRHAAARWGDTPPPGPVVAAGITTAAPAIARLLRTVAELPQGMVVLPGFDPAIDPAIWEALGPVPSQAGEEIEGKPVLGHPLYPIKRLLNAMGVSRDELMPIVPHRPAKRAADRARLIEAMFLPAALTDRWMALNQTGMPATGIRFAVAESQGDEAQILALAARRVLETPARRIAIVTPDRALAARVIAHLRRWNIAVDDSAGVPLAETPPGRLLLALAECVGDNFAPVPLLGLLKHPLVRAGEERLAWLDKVRPLDLALRGPRPAPGLAGIDRRLAEGAENSAAARASARCWPEFRALLEPLDQLCKASESLADAVAMLAERADALSGGAVWHGHAGRALADWVQALGEVGDQAGLPLRACDLLAVLSRMLGEVPVRQPFGTHPRLAIYGVLEARLQSADLVLAGGLNEGVWPPLPAPDPWLAPMVRRALGLPLAEERVGLAAQDLAGVLAAPEVLLTRAERDASAPTIASRFLLRLQAVVPGNRLRDDVLPALAQRLDQRLSLPPAERPAPRPRAEQRRVPVSATELDRLRADPYAYYARRILGLRTLDPVDAEPSHAWRGTAVHAVLEDWAKAGVLTEEALIERAHAFLDDASVHPLVVALWRPRLLGGLRWVAGEVEKHRAAGRMPALAEAQGSIELAGIRIIGKADRIDRLPDGQLAIVDYKTGSVPSAKQVEAGYALQLGILGLIAERGGFEGLSGVAGAFEYWALGKKSDNSPTGFGKVVSPVKDGRNRANWEPERMVPESTRFLEEAIARWLNGDAPFTARLNPDQPGYADYDQLMRLDEWFGRGDGEGNA